MFVTKEEIRQASSSPVLPREHRAKFSLPPMAMQPFTSVITYLTSRSIPENVVASLIRSKLLYQDSLHCNAVFVNKVQDYCEIRGTGYVPFHGSRKLKPDRFWYLPPKVSPRIAFLCEAAIDALSLMLIHKANQELYPDTVYVTIGGVANQQAIERIKRRIPAVLAVDNDPAGEDCCQKNPDLHHLIPSGKDWNVDLCAYCAP